MSSPAFTVLRRSAPPALTFAERQAQRAGAIQLTNLTPGIPVKVTIRPSGLGDHIENLVKPIAKALNWPCNDAAGRLKPESNCAKLRDALNQAMPFKGSLKPP